MSKQLEFITYVENGDVEKVKEYISKVDPGANESEALNSACVAGNVEMVKILLPWSDPNAVNGRTIKNAAFYGHTEIAKMLKDKTDREAVSEAMCVAAAQGNLDTLKAINTNNADDMNNALIWAASFENNDGDSNHRFETLKYLNRNANPNAYDGEAMIAAIETDNKKVIDLFFDRVDVDVIQKRISQDPYSDSGISGIGADYFNEKVLAYESMNPDVKSNIINNKTKETPERKNKKSFDF